jgi:WD40 repeat protein/serine/threonine protein kinase
MPQLASDRNLLLGILALQFGLISKDRLIDALGAWANDKKTGLEEILVRQGLLTPDGRVKLLSLLELHLNLHGGDPEKSLAALSSVGLAQGEVEQLRDSDLNASLMHVSLVTHPPEGDPYRTLSVGQTTSDGLRFRILRPHAKGGLGEVSVALDSELNREVALKEIQAKFADGGESRARFLLEAQITGGLEHPGIVPVYGMGTYADGRPYYAMRFIRGDSLKDGIRKFFAQFAAKGGSAPASGSEELPAKLPAAAYETIEFRQLLRRFVDVCNAVAYAHARGVLHRDLKPGNIMLGNYGETLVVDWGLAKATGKSDESLHTAQAPLTASTDTASADTCLGSALGTPGYMSPEQAGGRTDLFGPATDIYCLGATLYHLLTGQAPHRDNSSGELFQRIQKGVFPPPREVNPAIPAPLAAICLKAMATEPKSRYESALDLSKEIERWLAGDSVSAHRDSLLVKAQRWARRHRTAVTSAAALLMAGLIAVIIGYVVLRAEQSRTLAAQERTQLALTESQRQLAENRFQHGVSEYEARRYQLAMRDLRRAIATLPQPNPLLESYRQVLSDRLTMRNRSLLPPQRVGQEIDSLVFSPDGQRVLTLNNIEGDYAQKTARLWDALTGKPIGSSNPTISTRFSYRSQYHPQLGSAVFSPDGKRLLISGPENSARRLDAATGKAIEPPANHPARVFAAVYRRDGKRFLTICEDNSVRIWDAESGEVLGQPLAHPNAVLGADFHPAGERVVTACKDQALRIWDLKSHTLQGEPIAHPVPVTFAQYHPGGEVFLTVGDDTVPRLWRADSGELAGQLEVADDFEPSCSFSPDGGFALLKSGVRVRIWNLRTGEVKQLPLNGAEYVVSAAFSGDGLRIVTATSDFRNGTKRAQLWDTKSAQSFGDPFFHEGYLKAALSPDGLRLATSSEERLRLWEIDPYLPTLLMTNNLVNYAEYSPDGKFIVTAGADGVGQVWNAQDGQPIGAPLRHESGLTTARFSPNGEQVVTGGFDKTARLWDARTGQPLGEPLRREKIIGDALFTPDGKSILTAEYEPDLSGIFAKRDVSATLWDAKTGKLMGPFLSTGWGVARLRFSDDGLRLVSLSGLTTMELWETQAVQPSSFHVGFLLKHSEAAINHAEFSPDGQRLVSAGNDRTARLWNVTTGEELGEPMRQQNQVNWATFSPDGRQVATVNEDGLLIFWDGRTGVELGNSRQFTQKLRSVDWSPDGKRLLMVGRNGGVWTLSAGACGPDFGEKEDDWQAWVECMSGETASDATTFRPLTLEEWQERRAVLEQSQEWQAYLQEFHQPRIHSRHLDQADRAEAKQEWFAAAFHLRSLVQNSPADAKLVERLRNCEEKWRGELTMIEQAIAARTSAKPEPPRPPPEE